MYRSGREAVPDFAGAELLYLRYMSQHFVQGQLLPEGIRSQLRQSVNRGRFSEPEDALFSETGEYDGLGVVQFKVADIPARVDQPQGPAYVFFMRHEPVEENYSHSEIWSDHEVRTGAFRAPSRTVSLRFRIPLCASIRQEQVRIMAVR
jgi:hypothetical protein